jgi:membrane protein YqaA with SNARE-associated domain
LFLIRSGALGKRNGLVRLLSRRDRQLQFVILVAALAIVVTVWLLRGYITDLEVKDLGYPGVFFLSFLGSVSMVLPVPGLISVCSATVWLNPFLLGLLSGVGETLGEVSGYGVGYGGHSIVERHRFYIRLKRWMEERGVLVLFIVSAIPNPVFDFVGIAAGSVRFPIRKFMVTVLLGKLIKGFMVAYTCYFGVRILPWVE